MYKYYNANPLGKIQSDCVIRAISTVEGKTWDETYEELSDIAQEQGILLDDVNFVEPLLDSKYKRVCHKNKTVGEFAYENPYKKYLITMPGHITACIYGVIYDTFDCRNRKMWCAWEVK